MDWRGGASLDAVGRRGLRVGLLKGRDTPGGKKFKGVGCITAYELFRLLQGEVPND